MEIKEGYKKTKIGWIPEDWDIKPVCEIAEVLLSNVDKKTNISETEVLLCNYMDVFYNDYIDNSISFMKATASPSEIEKFTLIEDDVLLTKDSETEEDIAQSSVIVERFNGVLCGYHLAILRPMKDKVDGKFLMNSIKGDYVHNNFVKLVNGVTRFGLNKFSINTALIPLPPLPEQQKIASILTTIDDKISSIEDQIQKTEQLKKGLMAKLLTEGIGHTEFKDTKIGRIPKSWDIKPIGSIVIKIIGGGTPSRERDDYYNGGIPWITVKDLSTQIFYKHTSIEMISEEGLKNSASNLIIKNNIIISTRMGLGRGFINTVDMSINQDMKAIYLKLDLISNEFFLHWYFSKSSFIKQLGTGTTVKGISLNTLKAIYLPIPSTPEQKQIASILTTVDDKIEVLNSKETSYTTLKKGLLQQLLTGQMRVKL